MHPISAFSLFASLLVSASASGSATLFIRQAGGLDLSNIPDVCQATCAPIVSTVNSCQQLTCLCNNDVAKQIADCGDCLVGAAGDTTGSTQSKTQDVVDQFTNACNTSGEPVSSIQISSVAPSGSGASSATATATTTSASTSGSSTSSSSDSSSSAFRSVEINFAGAAGGVVFAGLTSVLYLLL